MFMNMFPMPTPAIMAGLLSCPRKIKLMFSCIMKAKLVKIAGIAWFKTVYTFSQYVSSSRSSDRGNNSIGTPLLSDVFLLSFYSSGKFGESAATS